MIIRLIILFTFLLSGVLGISQESGKPIQLYGKKPSIRLNGYPITHRMIKKIIQNDEEASAKFKEYSKTRRISLLIGFVGGYGLGHALTNRVEDYSVPLIAASGILIIGSSILHSKYKKGAVEVAKMYNNNLKMSSSLQFDVGVNGVSFSLNF